VLDRLPHLVALGAGRLPIGDAALARIARLDELHTLVLSKVPAAPDPLARLGALRRLERLYLDQTHADDRVLAALGCPDTLRVLHLEGSEVSDAGIPALHALGELEELTIGDTRMHGAIADLSAWAAAAHAVADRPRPHRPGAARARARPSLVALDLSATEIRDPSPLAALPRLRTLGVAQTHLSPAGAAVVKRLAARGVEVVR